MDHDHHMPGTGGMSPPPSTTTNGTNVVHHKTMMHMTFFWGKDALILFPGWPGTSTGMYVLALVFIFVLAVLVEWVSHCRSIKPGSKNVAAGLIQTLIHAISVGLAYMGMLAVMSFNGGVFIVAVAGHVVGFLIFGSRVFKDTEMPPYQKTSDLSPVSC